MYTSSFEGFPSISFGTLVRHQNLENHFSVLYCLKCLKMMLRSWRKSTISTDFLTVASSPLRGGRNHMTPYVTYHQGGGLIKSSCAMGQHSMKNQIVGQQCKIKQCIIEKRLPSHPGSAPVQEPYGGNCCCLTSYVTSSKELWCHISQLFHTSAVIVKIIEVIQHNFLVTDSV